LGGDRLPRTPTPLQPDRGGRDEQVPAAYRGAMRLYRTAQRLVRTAWPLIGRLDVRGIERIPRKGPFILAANHQSILNPILIQAVCPRPIHTLAKSSHFASPLFAWLMPRLLSFPVRRHQVDPQSVRYELRRLRE